MRRKLVVKTIEFIVYLALVAGLLSAPIYLFGWGAWNFRIGAVVFLCVLGAVWFKRGVAVWQGFVLVCAGLFIPLSVWAARGEFWPLVTLYCALLIVTVIGSLVLLHMVQMDISLDAMQLSAAQPVKQIISFDYKLMAALSAGIVVLTLIIYFALVAPVLSFVAGSFPALPQFSPPAASERDFTPSRDRDWEYLPREFEYLETPTTLPPFIGMVLHMIAVLAGLTAAWLLLYFVLGEVLRRITTRRQFYDSRMNNREFEDKREFILPRKEKPRRAPFPENETRRIFRETITRHIRAGVEIKKSDTPTDMKKRILAEDIGELAEEYSRARYS